VRRSSSRHEESPVVGPPRCAPIRGDEPSWTCGKKDVILQADLGPCADGIPVTMPALDEVRNPYVGAVPQWRTSGGSRQPSVDQSWAEPRGRGPKRTGARARPRRAPTRGGRARLHKPEGELTIAVEASTSATRGARHEAAGRKMTKHSGRSLGRVTWGRASGDSESAQAASGFASPDPSPACAALGKRSLGYGAGCEKAFRDTWRQTAGTRFEVGDF